MPRRTLAEDYISYDDRDRLRRSSAFISSIGIIGLAGFIGYKNRSQIAANILNFANESIIKTVGHAGVSNEFKHITNYNIEHRLVKEITKASRRIKGQAYASDVAYILFNDDTFLGFRRSFGEDNLRQAFGLGRSVDGKIIPGGNQYNSYKAFKKPSTVNSESIENDLITRFMKLSRHSNYADLISHRANSLMNGTVPLSSVEATFNAQREFAEQMAKVHMAANPASSSYDSSAIVDMVNKHYLENELAYQKNHYLDKFFNSLGVKVRRVGDDKKNSELLAFTIANARLDGNVGLLLHNLESFKDYNTLTIKLNGVEKDINLTLGSVAISKIYNKAREVVQLPVAPLQGGFGPFSFFPHMRGTSNQIIHSVDTRNPLPFISDLTNKFNLDDPSSLGGFYVVGKKGLFGSFKGVGQFIGKGAESTNYEAQGLANQALLNVPLEIRDAKAGWTKEVNERATVNYLDSVYNANKEQSIFQKMFFPGGKENEDSLFGKYASIFTKFKDPTYFPNVFENMLSSQVPSSEQIEKVGHTLITKSGYIDANHVGKLLHQDFNNLGDMRMFLDSELETLLKQGLHNDVAVFDYFSLQARKLNLPSTEEGVLQNTHLRNLVASFQTSLGTALGYGKNNDPITILDQVGLSAKGALGESSKSQGLEYIREHILGEINLKSEGKLAQYIKNSTHIADAEKHNLQSYLLGHDVTSILESGSDSSIYAANYNRAIELFRPRLNASAEDVANAHKNRFLVENLIKNRYPVYGIHWEQPNLGNIPVGSEHIKGRYLVTRATSPLSDLPGYIDNEYNNLRKFGQSVIDLTKGGTLSNVKDAFKGTEAYKQYSSFTKGIDDPSSFHVTPFSHYFLTSRLNHHFSNFGVSLGKDDMKSSFNILKAIGFKRLLPVLAIIRGLSYLDQKSEESGNDSLSPDNWYANTRANISLASARINDSLGITNFQKKLASLIPGAKEYLNFRPKSEEEYKEYLRTGRDPVRKSRGWLFGSRTPYAGNSLGFYEPNFYLRSTSNYESTHGGRKSQESFLLNNGFDLYAQENAASKGLFSKRPYVYSAPLVDPNIFFSGFINNTLGRILKPQKLLNDPTPYMSSSVPVEGTQGPSTGMFINGKGRGGKYIPAPPSRRAQSSVAIVNAGGSIIPKDAYGVNLITPDSSHLTEDEYNRILEQVQSEGKALLPVRKPNALFNEHAGKTPLNTNNLGLQKDQLANQTKQLSGIYGFFTSLFAPDKRNVPVFAEASRAYSFESSFYDANRGGTFLGIAGQLVGDQDINEIGRRLLTPKQKNLFYFNPIPNEFAGSDYIPGENNYVNYQEGDAFSKLTQGIMRLPGEAYRRLYKPSMLEMDAKNASLSKEELASSMIRPKLFTINTIKKAKQNLHKIFGPTIDIKNQIYENKELGIKGQVSAEIYGTPTVVKNLSSKEFSNIDDHYKKDSSELDLISYLSKKSVQVAYFSEDGRSKVISHSLNKNNLNNVLSKLNDARANVKDLVKNRVISEADLYDQITKFDIASDIAPYAESTRMLGSNISHTPGVLEGDWKKFQAIKKRTSEQKRQTEIFNYKFANLSERLRDHYGEVEFVDNKGVIYLKGQDTPLKLAGGRLSVKAVREYLENKNVKIPYGSSEIEVFLREKGIYAGKRINVKVDSDSPYENRKDLQETRRAVFGNLNKQLIDEGFIKATDTDNSPTSTYIKSSRSDRFFGTIFERLSHLDTIINTKFLKVRSPLEAYRRQVIYGTNEGSWKNPWDTYITPTISALASKNPITATLQGAVIGSFFGITKPAKLFGAKVGGAIGLGVSLLRKAYEGVSHKAWIPPSVARRREIEEYFDILKYVKERKLYEDTASEASQKENINIKNLIDKYEKHAKRNEALRDKYIEEKKALLRKRKTGDVQKKLDEVNGKIKQTKENLDILNLGPIATEALIHRKAYKSTLYGAKAGSSLMDVMSAMPRHERTILMESLKSSDKEKSDLYELLSNSQKRALGLYLGKKVEDLPQRPLLNEYFKSHQLPGENSAIWDKDVDIEDLKIRALKKEIPRTIELGIFPQTVTASEGRTSHIKVPYPEGETKDVQNKLNKILSGSYNKSSKMHIGHQHKNKDEDEIYISANIKHNRKKDYDNYVNTRM